MDKAPFDQLAIPFEESQAGYAPVILDIPRYLGDSASLMLLDPLSTIRARGEDYARNYIALIRFDAPALPDTLGQTEAARLLGITPMELKEISKQGKVKRIGQHWSTEDLLFYKLLLQPPSQD